MLKELRNKIVYFYSHPGFKSTPLGCIFRSLTWKLYKTFGGVAEVDMHKQSRMKLYPTARTGTAGLIYIFRENFEKHTKFAIEKFVTEGSVCYDIGANVGVWSLLMSELCGPAGQVYAFEPSKQTHNRLVENFNLSNCSNVTVYDFGLSDKEGEMPLYTPDDPGRSSLAPESENDLKETIKLSTLDQIWMQQGKPKVSFVKMDIEGSEPLALKGGLKFLHTTRPVISIEVNPPKLDAMSFHRDNIWEIFSSLNYSCMELDEDRMEFVPVKYESFKGGDYIFIPE